MAARRAAVVAEMADVGGGELVRRPADDAVARVGGVLERRAAVPRVVDPERDRAGASAREVADLRVVAVDDQRRVLRQLAPLRTPPLGDVLQLAVAVQLVAEEVAEQNGPRPHAPDDLGQRPFVHLEQPQLRIALREQRRGDAGDEIRAGAVPRERIRARGSRPPSRSSSSSRSSPRRPRRLAEGASRARRSRRDRASRAACRAASCRRPCPRGATACPRRERRAFRRQGGRSFRPRAYPQPTIPRTSELPRPSP